MKSSPKGNAAHAGDPHPMSIRFATEERAMIEKAAERDGLKFGSWVREIAGLSAERGIHVPKRGEKPQSKKVKAQASDPHPMSIRFSTRERTMIEKAAKRDGLKFGSWVREIAVLSAERGTRVTRKTEIKRPYSKSKAA